MLKAPDEFVLSGVLLFNDVMRLILLMFFLFLSSCALFEKQPESPDKIIQSASQQKLFLASYEDVWRAAHAVIQYPIQAENQDYGLIETEFVKGVDGWLPPEQTKPRYTGQRYKIIFTFARGKTRGQESTRLTIEKKIEVLRDFISEPQAIPTDGLEEQVIFYRIERELIVQNAIKKVQANTSFGND